MAEFWLGVMGSILASCIVALVTYIWKYIRRGKEIEVLQAHNDRLNMMLGTYKDSPESSRSLDITSES